MNRLKELFIATFHVSPITVNPITGSGSNRQYFRLSDNIHSAIGVIGTSKEENNAFIGITRHFYRQGLPVPKIYCVSSDMMAYLQSDLGKVSLYDRLSNAHVAGIYGETDIKLLKETISLLPLIQVKGSKGLDTSLCYPTATMDAKSIRFDLNYFKYCFLKLIPNLDFNEIKLENDFDLLTNDIITIAEESNYIMLRDCQSRNIMLKKDGDNIQPYFIDYQGCRLGPHEYDLASFLWQSSAKYPQSLRDELIETYIESLKNVADVPITIKKTHQRLRIMLLFRLLQVLGAYGFRGYIEHKKYFLDSIPPAINNLKILINNGISDKYLYLNTILTKLVSLFEEEENEKKNMEKETEAGLTVTVWSFSYKKGVPTDNSGNGGGYVFDCRSTHNPGKYEQYKQLTGLDRPVIDFLEKDGEIVSFLSHIYPIVEHHTQRFIERKFNSLMICFGCTGGQHRSVYSAQHTAQHLHALFPNIKIHLIHREQNIDKYL